VDLPMQRALKLVLALFPPGPANHEDVLRNCEDVLALLAFRGEELPNGELLIKEVESRVVIWQERSTSLEDRTGHEEWLAPHRDQIEWRFWDRYRRYLEQVELLPPAVISRTDESTDRVLGKLEFPSRQGEWDRRGLVVGQVQSGKTGHYTGLVCKAADAGYKLIVVLAGMHNSLRSQTQLRLDEGLLGFDSQYQYRYDEQTQSRIGVGAMPGAEPLKIGSLTTSNQAGDFKKNRAQNLALPIGDMPVLLVVKKHSSILENLRLWVTQMHGRPVAPDSKELIVSDIPLLIIDDEADNASINTKNLDEDPATINRRIRSLLKAFDKSAYVGYTATPFANIYSSTTEDDEWGLDLFPRHFIESLKPPSNYFGPTRVFGLLGEDEEVSRDPLPILREVTDYADWMPDRHNTSWSPPSEEFPASLRQAILSFFLVCAARRARGQADKHNSMLVHTTRLKAVQLLASEQVEELLTTTRYRLRYGDGEGPNIWDELRSIWERDFLPTSSVWDQDADLHEWDVIRDHVSPAVEKISVMTINGSSRDALEYYEHRDSGLSVIAIGGDKLSRGLTLEGLSISYYLRATRMYDTLMQMGRWFGYRAQYEDLCRLYTTPMLYAWYREITAASEELRADFDDMAGRRATPEQYGLRVRQSPAGLSVTSPGKMRTAKSVSLTFSGDISETSTFDADASALKANRTNLEAFVEHLNARYETPARQPGGNYVWTGVTGTALADEFFQGYRAEKMALRARPELIARYIRDSVKVGELTNWTVVMVGNSQARLTAPIGALNVGLTLRSPLDEADIVNSKRYTIRRVLSPTDETIGMSKSQIDAALAALRLELHAKATPEKPFKEPKYPRGATLRRQRPPTSALLLIYLLDNVGKEGAIYVNEPMVGFAVSFPFSAMNVTAKYQVNEIWRLLAFDDLVSDDD
jgi:hypothetical protein